MCLRRSLLRLALIAALLSSSCATAQTKETQPPSVQTYDVADGSRPSQCDNGPARC
jgi:hypothetical protein